jgi:myo-inositol-1(or 4)-monophosphatase
MLDFILNAMRQAGEICLESYQKIEEAEIRFKSAVDMVTEVDLRVQRFLEERLTEKFPDIAFLGEEGEQEVEEGPEGLFIVDPLDGTTSYVQGLPFYCISVAYRREGETRLGAVYAPSLDLLYHAEKGGGASCNGRPISVSTAGKLIESVAGVSFGCVRHRIKPDTIPLLAGIIYGLKDIRRFGSIAIDLCFVADGHFDLFWGFNAYPWDIAAGVLIVQEAGGKVTDLTGGNAFEETRQIAASNGRIHDDFISIARKFVL